MVFFTCGNCGESMKKPSVAKHYMGNCRGPPNVTCVDCFKDFRGNEYEAHIKCLTEDERYSAKGFVPKPSSNKGEKKQQTWFVAVQNILESDRQLGPEERKLLAVLSAHENLPRKHGKFLNFIANAHRAYARRQDLVERVWSIIEETGKAATGNTGNANGTNGIHENGDQKVQDEIITDSTKAVKELINEESASKKDKKRKKKEKVADELQADDSSQEPDEPQTPSKKMKREKTVKEETSKNLKTENIVRAILENEGGNISFYELYQALEKHCTAQVGSEKAKKVLKKIQKQITIKLDSDLITMDVDQVNVS